MAMTLKHIEMMSEELRTELDKYYFELVTRYNLGTISNVNILIYVGKILLEKSLRRKDVLSSLERVAQELEIKSLSYDLLSYRKENASKSGKKMYDLMIDDLLQE
jgi:hypothetical protein